MYLQDFANLMLSIVVALLCPELMYLTEVLMAVMGNVKTLLLPLIY